MSDVSHRHHIKINGSGTQPMLFAHGVGCDQNMWRQLTPFFEKDYQLVLFDYMGSGHSSLQYYNAEKYSTLKGYADDIIAIAEGLQLTNIIFIGHSVSAIIGMLAAIARPQLFQKIIMIGPSACYLNTKDYKGGFDRQEIDDLLARMKNNFTGWAAAFAPSVMGSQQPVLSREWEQSVCRTRPDITLQFAKATFLADNRADLPFLKTPALILQCADDLIAPVEAGTFMAQQIPNSEIYFLKSKGHSPHLSAPAETAALIKEYLGG